MKSAIVLCLMIVTLAVAASASMAVMTNKDEDRPMIPSADQLTPDDDRDPGRVLYAPSEEDDPDYRAAIAAFTGGTADYFDARVATPSHRVDGDLRLRPHGAELRLSGSGRLWRQPG